MKDENKTKKELIDKLKRLRQRIMMLDKSESKIERVKAITKTGRKRTHGVFRRKMNESEMNIRIYTSHIISNINDGKE